MLLVENKKVETGSAEAIKILNRWEGNWLATAYLKSIMNAKSKHSYASLKYLGFNLTLVSKMKQASVIISQKVKLDTGDVTLDSNYWQVYEQNKIKTFQCKNDDFAQAVKATLKDKRKNRLECKLMSHLIAVYALLETLGPQQFNQFLNKCLKPSKERLKLPINDSLLQSEALNYPAKGELYEGDHFFRPGDLVGFRVLMKEAYRTWTYGIENGICIGWLSKGKDEPNFNEPIFVGSGILHMYGAKEGQPKMLTEAQMKEQIWREIIYTISISEKLNRESKCPDKKENETPQEMEAREKCEYIAERRANIIADHKSVPQKLRILFAKKAMDLPADFDPDNKTEYSILPHLFPVVSRFSIFGGRDLP